MLSKKLTIINKLGLHARASSKFVATANRFSSHIEIIKGEKKVNAKSIMGVMMLAASKGSEIEVIANGEDAARALDEITRLVEDRFGEDE